MTEESPPELLSSIVLFKLIVSFGGPDDDPVLERNANQSRKK